MPKIHGIYEWCFVDPATVVDGKDGRGRNVLEIYGPGHPTGPPASGFFPSQFGRWPESLERFAEAIAKHATALEQREPGTPRAISARDATRTAARTHLAKVEVK